jgi:hypothetical protein
MFYCCLYTNDTWSCTPLNKPKHFKNINLKKNWTKILLKVKNIFNSCNNWHVAWKLIADFVVFFTTFEPRHDKTNIMDLRPAWIQTSLRFRAVWTGSMLFAISFSTCYRVCKRTAWILIILRGCAGWSGSMSAANPLCWFCHDAAHFFFVCNAGRVFILHILTLFWIFCGLKVPFAICQLHVFSLFTWKYFTF